MTQKTNGKPYCSKEVMKWLEGNAYLIKTGDYYYFRDFPKDKTAERIHIPLSSVAWKRLNNQLRDECL